MDSEDKKLLLRILDIAEENHRILRKLRRASMWSTTLRIIYWIVILGVSIGLLYFLEPYLDAFQKASGNFRELLGNMNSLVK